MLQIKSCRFYVEKNNSISTLFIASNNLFGDEVDSPSTTQNNARSDAIRKLESNPYRRVYLNKNDVLSKSNLNKKSDVKAKQAIQDLSIKEGEALTASEKRTIAKTTFDTEFNELLNVDAIKSQYFNGFKVSENTYSCYAQCSRRYWR